MLPALDECPLGRLEGFGVGSAPHAAAQRVHDDSRGIKAELSRVHRLCHPREAPRQLVPFERRARADAQAEPDAAMRFAQADPQQAREQLGVVAVALPRCEAALAQLLPGSPRDLAGDRDATGIDQPTELLPALGPLQQLSIARGRRPEGRAATSTIDVAIRCGPCMRTS